MPGVDPSTLPKITPFTKVWHTHPYPFILPTRPELSAAGRNIVVAGGSSGIGLAVATAFAQAGAASVSIIGRRLDKLQSAVSSIPSTVTKVICEQADLAVRALHNISNQVGKIDVLVSNAGPDPSDGVVADATDQALQSVFTGVVVQAVHVIQAWLPLASAQPVLLSTNTCLAHWAPIPGIGLYSLARAALTKFTDYVQAENPHVRVVSVQPGWVATAANGFQEEATDVAELPGCFYVWLASGEADFLKGKFVWANWDAEELVSRKDEIQGEKMLTVLLKGVDDI